MGYSHVVQRSYYRASSGVEAHRVIDVWQMTFNLGCVLKYVCRAGNKAGASLENDFNKALTYVDFEIDFYDRVLNGEQGIHRFKGACPQVDEKYLPKSVGDAWALNSLQVSVLSELFEASNDYRSGCYEKAIQRLERIIPMLLEGRNG